MKLTRKAGVSLRLLIACLCLLLAVLCAAGAPIAPGYTVHFNFIHSKHDVVVTLRAARRAGARVINLVPPAHVWEDQVSLRELDFTFKEAQRLGLAIIVTRMDAQRSNGFPWLFDKILGENGVMPDGSQTAGDWFCATVGNHSFERWQQEETSYYARRYGKNPALHAVAVGGMVEPFVSQRGSLVQWDDHTVTYELCQYTDEGREEWHRWLRARFPTLAALNHDYGTQLTAFDAVPMPRSGEDPAFAQPHVAYFDLVQCMNDWVLRQYRDNRKLWHAGSSTPFLLQLSGFTVDKITYGRPEFAAFDLPTWLEEADGVGLSLYTDRRYADWGHASDRATLELLATARESGKPAFELESGCEDPRVTLDPHELEFITRFGLLLRPRTDIYEYFRYQRDNTVEPGMMMSQAGLINRPAYDTVSRQLRDLHRRHVALPVPCFTYLTVPLTARASLLAARVNRAAYLLAGYVPCRLLPWACFRRLKTGTLVLLPPGAAQAISADSLHEFLLAARDQHWCITSDRPTCDALRALGAGVAMAPLDLAPFAQADCVEDQADALLDALRDVPACAHLLDLLPIEPRPGLYWLQDGRRLLLWTDTAEPVICYPDTWRRAKITRLWGSTADGKAMRLQWDTGASHQEFSLACRQWAPVPAVGKEQ